MLESDSELLFHFRALGLTTVEAEELMKFALDFKHWNTSHLCHLHYCIKSSHDFSLIAFEHLSGVYWCSRGTLAGTALADILFCHLMFKFLTVPGK